MTLPTITTRTAKGSALTFAEMDTNFANLANVTVPITVITKTGATAGVVSTTAALGYTLQAASGGNVNLAVAGNVITISSLAGSGGGGSDTFNSGDLSGLGPVEIRADTLSLGGGIVLMGANSQGNAIVASTSAVGGDDTMTTGAMATMISHDPASSACQVAGIIVPDTSSAFASNVTTAGFAITQQAGWGNVHIPVTNGTTPVHYKFSNVGIKFTDNTVQSTAAVTFTGGTMTSNIAMANQWLTGVQALRYQDGTTNTTAALPLTGGTVSGNIALGANWLTGVQALRYQDGTTDATASLPLGGGSLTGNVNFQTNYINNAIHTNTREAVSNIGTSGSTPTINANTAPYHIMVANTNITLNTTAFTNLNAGQTVTVKIIQDATGSRTLTSNVIFAGASKTLSTAAGSIDTITVFYDGVHYLGSLVKGYA